VIRRAGGSNTPSGSGSTEAPSYTSPDQADPFQRTITPLSPTAHTFCAEVPVTSYRLRQRTGSR